MDIDLSGAVRPGLLLGGRYRLAEPIGAGGMAVVWRARDDVLARTVAVKLLAPHARDTESPALIQREARAAASLSHPNIAQVYDYGESVVAGEAVPYVVLELVPGGTLLDRLRRGEVPPRFAMRVCAEVGAALAAAHAEGIVHRDIKPANVMLAPTGAKVVDFGIAAAHGHGAGDATLLGTPTYMAPERLLGDEVVPASDVYALGVLLYRLLAGHVPWPDESPTRVLANHVHTNPPPLVPRGTVPAAVIDLCARCLRKDPEMRPTAREVTRVLARAAGLDVVEDTPAPAAPGAAVPAEPSMIVRPPARHPARTALRIAAGVLVIAAGSAGGWLISHRGDSGAAPPGIAAPATADSPVTAPTPGPGGAPAATSPRGTPARIQPAASGTRPTTATPTAPGATATVPATATTPPAAPDPTPVRRTLTSPAGTVTADCPAATTAHILAWTANRSYKVESADTVPGPAPAVVFRHGKDLVTVTVTCAAGVPSAQVTGP